MATTTLMAFMAGPSLAEESTPQNSATALWQTLATLDFPIEKRASFRETRNTRLLRKPVEQRGTLWIDSTGDFVMQVLEPRAEERRLSKQRLSLLRKRTDRQGKVRTRQRSIKLDPDKGSHQLLLSIVDVLKGNVERLKQEFRITTAPESSTPPVNAGTAEERSTNSTWVLVLTPIQSALQKDLQELVLRGHGRELQSLRTVHSATSWQEIEILTTHAGPTPLPTATATPKIIGD